MYTGTNEGLSRMNVKNRNSYYLTVTLLWFLSIFSASAFGETERVRVSSSNDDAEERIRDGDMYRNSTDLEFGYDGYVSGLQIVGMRFQRVDIPQGAIINSAYIEFTVDETDSGTTNLVIFGQDYDSPDRFENNNGNISDRTKTAASVSWAPSRWNRKNETHQTPDISTIIQEIVDRSGWVAKNNLVLIVEPGSGCTGSSCQRTAESYDGRRNKAPLLIVDYTVVPTLKTPIFSSLDGILGGQLKGVNFHIGTVGNGNNQWPNNEGPEHLIDDVGQKYLNFGEHNTGAIITPNIGCSIVDAIKFWTANDFGSRDPASYELYGTNKSISGSKHYLSDFYLLSEGNLTLPVSRNSNGNSALDDLNSQTISFTNTSSYTSYLLYFPSVKNKSSANSMQLGEVQVFGSTCSDPTPVIHHYEISHDGQGLTCEAEEVTISACTNTDGATCVLSNDTLVLLDVKATGSRSVTVPVSSTDPGTGKAYIPYTIKDSTLLSLLGTSLPTVCFDGSVASCNLDFADTGFQFTNSINSNGIPAQLSGKPSNVGYNSSTLSLQAIKTNPVSGACEAALIDDKPIELVAKCIDPAICKSKTVMINSTSISTLDAAEPNTYTSVELDFGDKNNNAATFYLTYLDAGKVQLHARYKISVDGSSPVDYMQGGSNSFVVRPLGFYIDATDNPKAESAADAKYKKAGEEFTTSVTAVQWQARDDLDNDGIPDDGSDLSGNNATPNFGQESVAETVVLAHQLIEPLGGASGSLSGNIIADFTSGKGNTTNLSWSEVGIINLTANLSSSSYIGAGPITGTIPYVGRFIPDHFKQTIKATSGSTLGDEGSLTVNHNNAFSECRRVDWAYSGQSTDIGGNTQGSIRYFTPPKLTITAYNSASQVTINYTSDFAKLMSLGSNGNEISFLAPKTIHSNGLNLTGGAELGEMVDLGGGVLTYQLSEKDHFVYTRGTSSEIAPFQAEFELPFDVFKDSDDVTFKASNLGIDYFESPEFYGNADFNNTVEIRFGRLVLKNSFGPETSNLTQPMQVEHFDGNDFIVSSDNNCVSYDDEKIILDDSAPTIALGGDGKFIAGETREIQLQAANVKGDINVIYDAYDWLEYDWDSEIGYDDPFAVATFGFFRGNDRVIYRRRVNN